MKEITAIQSDVRPAEAEKDRCASRRQVDVDWTETEFFKVWLRLAREPKGQRRK